MRGAFRRLGQDGAFPRISAAHRGHPSPGSGRTSKALSKCDANSGPKTIRVGLI